MLLEEIEGNEADCFPKFPAYIEKLKASDSQNMTQLDITEDNTFQAVSFAPAVLRWAFRNECLRPFTAIDACHTKSKFCMMLMLCVGIDANDNVLPLAWALVPTENQEWWT
jgi:hypothetical protein